MNVALRPTIAYLTTFFPSDQINYLIWSGISTYAREHDVNVIAFPGNPPNSPFDFQRQANSIYDLVNKKYIQGILFWSGGLGGHVRPEDLADFYRRFEGFPAINISGRTGDLPCILTDNYQGMYQACAHLIERHGCRRIAFLRGPAIHEEAELRFRAYRDALAAHGLPVEPGLILQGDFQPSSGRQAACVLLDERGIEFDAIAVASDIMAIAAMAELRSRGIDVPGKVKIVGFDDIPESRYLTVPLTTVRQPFIEMGRLALKNILALIRGESFERQVVIPCRLIERQSCGCLHTARPWNGKNLGRRPRDRQRPLSVTSARGRRPAASSRRRNHPGLKKAMKAFAFPEKPASSPPGGIFPRAAARRLVNAFATELLGNARHTFLPALNRVLIRSGNMTEVDALQDWLAALHGGVIQAAGANIRIISRADGLFHQGAMLIAQFSLRLIAHENFEKQFRDELLQEISREFSTTFHIGGLMAALARNLLPLGIQTCFLALYERAPVTLKEARLLLAFSEGTTVPLPENGVLFPADEIIPRRLLPENRPTALIIEPLYFREEPLGFAVFEESLREGTAYDVLRSQLSVAIKGALLFQEKETLLGNESKHARHLQRVLRKLRQSNEDLENFTHIASHDLKEPLRKISVFTTRLEDTSRTPLGTAERDYLARIKSAVTRMEQLINDLLDFSRLTTRIIPFQTVDLSRIITDVLTDIEALVEREQAGVTADPLPTIEAEPLQMRQLFQNLLSNAIKYHKPGEKPMVTVTRAGKTVDGREMCEITVADNGIGIEEKYFEKIFVIFQRLYGRDEYEGTGIGLAICKKIVERHQGDIRVESTSGQGSKFIITLPLRQTVEGENPEIE